MGQKLQPGLEHITEISLEAQESSALSWPFLNTGMAWIAPHGAGFKPSHCPGLAGAAKGIQEPRGAPNSANV